MGLIGKEERGVGLSRSCTIDFSFLEGKLIFWGCLLFSSIDFSCEGEGNLFQDSYSFLDQNLHCKGKPIQFSNSERSFASPKQTVDTETSCCFYLRIYNYLTF